jgi:hypothetical protein
MGQTYGKAPIVTGTPPVFPSAPLVSTDLKESGSWLCWATHRRHLRLLGPNLATSDFFVASCLLRDGPAG